MKVERVGFTGSRMGMTLSQIEGVEEVLVELRPKLVHHGMCVGSDCEFEEIVRAVLPKAKVIGHPGVDRNGNAPTRGDSRPDFVRDSKHYLERDRDIVRVTNHLIATPNRDGEVLRSGTWATIRRARETGRPVTIIYPDGRRETSAGS